MEFHAGDTLRKKGFAFVD